MATEAAAATTTAAAAAPPTIVVARRRWSELFVTAGLVGCIVAVCLRLYTLEQRVERLEDEPTYRPMTPPPRTACPMRPREERFAREEERVAREEEHIQEPTRDKEEPSRVQATREDPQETYASEDEEEEAPPSELPVEEERVAEDADER
jgi:hypothetical protein